MQTLHHVFLLAGHRLHQVDFDPATFQPHDLLWLPHAARLQNSGRKRQAEHLAGRIAAVHALSDFGEKSVPAIGERRQPLWPAGLAGSISHCATRALAVVARQPIGIDTEDILSPALAAELRDSIITPAERAALEHSGLPFELALTLAFSAKESGFKALSGQATSLPGFHSAEVIALAGSVLRLRLNTDFSPHLVNTILNINWLRTDRHIITCACPSGES